jgi:hypothetical protein
MNSFQLKRHDTDQTLRLWGCGRCGHIYATQLVADQCCLCVACQQPVSDSPRDFYGATGYPTHTECRHKRDRQREAERMDKAEKLDQWDGWVYRDGCGCNEGYFESVDDFLEWWEDEYEGEQPPEFIWTCKPERIVPPADEILEGLLERWIESGWEDMDESDLTGIDELAAAVKAFSEANENVVAHYPDCKRAVRVREASK